MSQPGWPPPVVVFVLRGDEDQILWLQRMLTVPRVGDVVTLPDEQAVVAWLEGLPADDLETALPWIDPDDAVFRRGPAVAGIDDTGGFIVTSVEWVPSSGRVIVYFDTTSGAVEAVEDLESGRRVVQGPPEYLAGALRPGRKHRGARAPRRRRK